MRLVWVELRGFRSYDRLRFEPEPGINVLVGRNGAGKTNLLEAIGYLSRLKSFRRVPDGALLATGATAAVIRGEFASAGGPVTVEVEIPAQGRRRVLVDGKRPQRYGDVPARVPMVTFLPDDLDIVKRGPSLRREALDDLAAALWPTAAAEQQEYERTLRQRNAMLRRDGRDADRAELASWDQRLAVTGARVILRRLRLIGEMQAALEAVWKAIGTGGTLRWEYVGKVLPAGGGEAELAAALAGALRERHPVDLERRVTTVGPHRDDPVLRIDQRDVRTGASQGEQRTAALALRLVSHDLLRARHGAPPVVLLDDVFSELDAVRTGAVVERLPGGQVLITTAREEDVPVTGKRWSVAGGRVT